MLSVTRFASLVALAALAGCSSASPGPDLGGGGAAEDSGAGADGAPKSDGAPDRGTQPGTCPATPPSGECSDPDLQCPYVDDEGCPQKYDCLQIFVSPTWYQRIVGPGGACSKAGQICTYSEAIGDNLPSYGALKCGDSGKWETQSLCPPTLPMDGESCAYAYLSCTYQGACGGTKSVLAYCNGPVDGWAIEPCPDAGP